MSFTLKNFGISAFSCLFSHLSIVKWWMITICRIPDLHAAWNLEYRSTTFELGRGKWPPCKYGHLAALFAWCLFSVVLIYLFTFYLKTDISVSLWVIACEIVMIEQHIVIQAQFTIMHFCVRFTDTFQSSWCRLKIKQLFYLYSET